MSRIRITVPTWNEAVVIERNLRLLVEAVRIHLPAHTVTIEVADNASTDDTRAVVQCVKTGLSNVQLLECDEQGKGLAIKTSWSHDLDTVDVLAFTDADLAADLEALPRLIEPIVRGEADVVCGSRFLGGRIERSWMREIASRLYRLLQRSILSLPVRDAQCGFKAISNRAARELLPLCRERGWMFDSELLACAARRGYRVREIPVDWIEHRDPARRSALHLFRHGWGFLAGLIRIRSRRRANS
jgi:glycosyltransferase involved in cell wall biosynthesis